MDKSLSGTELIEDQTDRIIVEVGECQFSLVTFEANCANEQIEAVHLLSEGILYPLSGG